MRLSDVVEAMRVRCGGLTDERVKALVSDMRAAGVHDGPALQDAFDGWRSTWDKRYAPTAGEFAKYYHHPQAKPESTGPQLAAGERLVSFEEAQERLIRQSERYGAFVRGKMGPDKYDGTIMEAMKRFQRGEKVSAILKGKP